MNEKSEILKRLASNIEDFTVNERIQFAKDGKILRYLVNDREWLVRYFVAKNGYGLDKLIHDEDWWVRKAVAEQGYGLDILINDKNNVIRKIVREKLNELKK